MGVNLFQYKTVCLFLIPKYSSLFVFVLSEIICIFAFIYDGTWLAKLRYRAMKALQQKEQNYIVEINMTKAKPFLKWAGDKSQLLSQLDNHLSQDLKKRHSEEKKTFLKIITLKVA